MSTKEAFIETVKAKMEAWKADVERLQAHAAGIDPAEIRHYTATVQTILAKIQELEKRFSDGGHLSTATWQELRRRAEDAFADIDSLVDDAKRKYLP
jgi:hypothetical protein